MCVWMCRDRSWPLGVQRSQMSKYKQIESYNGCLTKRMNIQFSCLFELKLLSRYTINKSLWFDDKEILKKLSVNVNFFDDLRCCNWDQNSPKPVQSSYELKYFPCTYWSDTTPFSVSPWAWSIVYFPHLKIWRSW